MNNAPSIFLVDDEPELLRSLEMTLKIAGFSDIRCFVSGLEAHRELTSQNVDLIILDVMMPDINGYELLKKIKETNPDLPVIMMTGVNEIGLAVRCIKNNAFDYILKPAENERILTSVRNALKLKELYRENEQLREQFLVGELSNPEAFSEIVTQNEKVLRIFQYVEAVAVTNHPVLITGETGVGKELIARSLHKASKKTGRFVAINVAGLDDSLFSDTLFGHNKGAFTGADSVRKRLIENAANGTLFLDEIGDLSLQSQIKLLRLIQEKEYSPLGSDTLRYCNARIITATCKNLDVLKNSNTFRKDLFYRLRTHHVHIPSLREHKNDLELLVRTFIKSDKVISIPIIPKELITLLNTYNFPGNIRELQSMVYDALSQHKGNVLSLKSFKAKMGVSEKSESDDVNSIDSLSSEQEKQIVFPDKLPSLKEMEGILIEEAVRRADGNQTIAANLLGITRQALGYRLKK